FVLDAANIECLGAADAVPGLRPAPGDLREVLLRVAVRDSRREAVERFTAEFAPLITSGPPGLAGYASGRSAVRPVFAYWPALVPRDFVKCHVDVRPASKWLEE